MGVAAVVAERAMARRILVVHLPAFRLERCGYSADDVAGLVAEVKSAARIVAVTPAAHDQGLRVGMTATAARALIPDVLLEELDELGEQEDRADLVGTFLELSDQVAPLFDDGLMLEVQRTAHLFGGEEGIARRARELAAELGHRCKVSVADDPLAGEALTRFTDGGVIPPGGGGEALAALPLAALRPSPELIEAWTAIGLSTAGDLARLDAASVRGRYGDEGHRLLRVARGEAASGLLIGGGAEERATSGVVFGCEVDLVEGLVSVVPKLLKQLSRQLSGRDQVAVQMLVRLVTRAGTTSIRVRPARPSRNPDLFLRLIRARLSDLRLAAPVTELHLEVEECAPELGWQPGLTDRAEMREPLPEIVDRLKETLGEATVFVSETRDRWRPEAAWEPRLELPRSRLLDGGELDLDPEDPVDRQETAEQALTRPRPVVLLEMPVAIEARIDARGSPIAIHLESGWFPVRRSAGPERLQGEWWMQDGGFDRDYFAVDVHDGAAWVFREGERWFLHGWFD